jgi:hypothetical protein
MRISSSAPGESSNSYEPVLDRVIRDIRRKIEGDHALEDRFGPLLDLALYSRAPPTPPQGSQANLSIFGGGGPNLRPIGHVNLPRLALRSLTPQIDQAD